MEKAERIHLLFRGASEAAKFLLYLGVIIELGLALLSTLAIFKICSSPYTPLIVLFASFVTLLTRHFYSNAKSFARLAKNVSLRAFCSGIDLDNITSTNFKIDAPLGTKFLSKKYCNSNLNDYYEPTTPVGEARVRELYAHSAFYTWRQAQVCFLIATIIAVLVFLICFTFFFSLTTSEYSQDTVQKTTEAICTIVLVQFCLRVIDLALAYRASASDSRRIEQAFFKVSSYEEVLQLTHEYDLERAVGPHCPTFMYFFLRDGFKTEWHERRQDLR